MQTPEQLGEPLDLSVVDVSFISLKIVLPAIQKLLKPRRSSKQVRLISVI